MPILAPRTATAIVAPLAMLPGVPAWAMGDAAHGAVVFRICSACHTTSPGQHMTGPSLANIWQRKAGTAQGFKRYSDAMRHADIVWTKDTLDRWLADPEALIPGTTMTFAGLSEEKARDDVISYLKAVSEGKAPSGSQVPRGMMMNAPSAHPDMKAAPPEGRVTALTHCADTYTVTTADGKVDQVWEFNLRLKTDSSALGLLRGKPVIVGAGMQGDRASVVFASPGEISTFIRSDCPKTR